MIQKINNIILSLKSVITRHTLTCHCEERSDEAISKRTTLGQTALILILLTAAALIFVAITLNWGRLAQVKTLLTTAAYESVATLASEAASYGEQEKQTYLQNANYKSSLTGVLLSIIVLIISIICMFIPGLQPVAGWAMGLAIAGMVMTFVSIVLQLVWINPMISKLWNNLQKNQPIQQQFYEAGISAALQGAVTDQVNITDYFDWNANGVVGNNASSFPTDIVSRFAIFYTDRLKMLNQPDIPQVVFFYNQLGELMNGETCAQNAIDSCLYPGSFSLNSQCPSDCAVNDPFTNNKSCVETSADPACQLKIPNGFQLNDPCTDSMPGSPTYNPYCDPCCQQVSVLNPEYCSVSTDTKTTPSSGSSSTNCTGTTSTGASCNCDPLVSQYVSLRPSNCDPGLYDSNGNPQCQINNPYNSAPGGPYPLLYDPSYQEYANNVSFLAQFGRDQQMGPFTTNLTSQGLFPNGIYPFFWLMKDYSPEVDNIVSTSLQSSQSHWCTASTAPGYTAPAGFSDLAQLTLPYACSGQDCCVNGLANSVTSGVPTITTGSTTSGTTNWVIDAVGSSSLASNAPNPALDPSFGESGSGSWQEGDNQMCLNTPPYNGATADMPDGTCEWTAANPPATTSPSPGPTMDSLDDTMHTLSDFVNFANNFLGKDIGTLSASFTSWYPQVAVWISSTCDDSSACTSGQCSDGTLCDRLQPLASRLNAWNTVITNWLNNNYASSSAWCVPPTPTGFANEDSAITNNGAVAWGSLPSVINCLNYNATAPASNYQACWQWLQSPSCSNASQVTGTPCDPATLGRSLEPQPTTTTTTTTTTVTWSPASCASTTDPYAAWVNDSWNLFTDEAPKFTLRSLFLTDINTRAQTMKNIFNQGGQQLQSFLNGPAAQLVAASSPTATTILLPNSVIYGWVDNNLPNGLPGYAHIVKVTAYAPGHDPNQVLARALLPWLKTKVGLVHRTFTLTDRDGYVYVSVRRWDQDHPNPLFFPNGRPLWQFLFHNPKGGVVATGSDFFSCIGEGGFGFGLTHQTVIGLQNPNVGISSADQTSLSQAFMLNDEGNGAVDPNATGSYSACLSQVNALLINAPESHACAEYVASINATGPSCANGSPAGCVGPENDYSLKFVDCNSVPGYRPPDDLMGGEQPTS
jgi:hypothetical protein